MRAFALQMSFWALLGAVPVWAASPGLASVRTTDVPESSTTSMFLMGFLMVGVGVVRRRRRG